MSRQTFSWFPDVGSDFSIKPKVEVTQYGDGYETRTPRGLNTTPMTWNLTFTREGSISRAIQAFLKARGGSESFYWTNPLEELGIYVCREWKVRRMTGDTMQVTCAFEQVFEA